MAKGGETGQVGRAATHARSSPARSSSARLTVTIGIRSTRRSRPQTCANSADRDRSGIGEIAACAELAGVDKNISRHGQLGLHGRGYSVISLKRLPRRTAEESQIQKAIGSWF